MLRFRLPLGVCFMVALLAGLPASGDGKARAAIIAEVLTQPHAGPSGWMPSYIEIDFFSPPPPVVELVILDANPNFASKRVKQVVTFQTHGREAALLHHGALPASLLPIAELVAAPDPWQLTDPSLAMARRLVIFDRPTGWVVGQVAPDFSQWTGYMDSIAYSTTAFTQPAPIHPGEPLFLINDGEAIFRGVRIADSAILGTSGPVTDRLAFTPSLRLNPGFLNPFVTGVSGPPTMLSIIPLPTGALAGAAGLLLLAWRRRRV